MKLHIRQLIRPLALLAFVATPALAGDFYVDAVHGNDGNGGSATMDAWRTLTYALSTIPATPFVPHTIYVAPGTYDAALGERFPLVMRPDIRLVGTAGSAVTILAGPASTLVQFTNTSPVSTGSFDATSGADGLTLRDATRGIEVWSSWGYARPTFTDLLIEDMTEFGFYVYGGAQDYHHWGYADPLLTNVTIAGCACGLRLETTSPNDSGGTRAEVTLEDCTVRDCTGDGLSITSHNRGGAVLSLSRTRVVGNAGNGVAGGSAMPVLHTATLISVIASDSLIAANGDAGIRVTGAGYGGSSTLVIETHQATIANNATAGIVIGPASYSAGQATRMELWNSIVSGNGDDLAVISPGSPIGDVIFGHWSDSGDGELLGDEGCISADPLFVAPASGDYRLAFGSPCIDTASLAFMTSNDLVGSTRPFDGDLDTVASPDMGAIEFAPLYAAGFEPGNTRLMLELWGPDYGRSILYLSDTPVLTTPEATPFGSFFLVRSTAVVIPMARIQSRTSNLLELKIPALAVPGSTVSLQALIRSHAAPSGAAWSNPLELVVAP